MTTAYNPNDPTQRAFLASIAAGESGGSANPAMVGYGGTNLAGVSTDAYGFPQWAGAVTGAGPTHAAGIYQFQPGTWDGIAGANGLNFQNPQDQSAGAWLLAQQQYSANTGGGNLYGDLQAGNYGQVATALHPTWTSISSASLANAAATGAAPPDGNTAIVNGNGAAAVAGQVPDPNSPVGTIRIPMGGAGAPTTGLDSAGTAVQTMANQAAGAAALALSVKGSTAQAIGAAAQAAATYVSTAETAAVNAVSGAVSAAQKSVIGALGGALSSLENWIGRGFLILIGVVIIGAALWALLSQHDLAPSPATVAKAAVL